MARSDPVRRRKSGLETDENLQDYFETVNSGRTLYISSEARFRKPAFTKCHTRVYLRQLSTLLVRCDGGKVICPGDVHYYGDAVSKDVKQYGDGRITHAG